MMFARSLAIAAVALALGAAPPVRAQSFSEPPWFYF